MITLAQFNALYSDLAIFEREKGYMCGKSFVSIRRKCYKNPKTGKDLGFKYIVNPKTGRRKKTRVGLTYKEYSKARKSAVKKKGQGKRLTNLDQKYLADVERLTISTRKKKQRRLDAKNKRKQARSTSTPQPFNKTTQSKSPISDDLQSQKEKIYISARQNRGDLKFIENSNPETHKNKISELTLKLDKHKSSTLKRGIGDRKKSIAELTRQEYINSFPGTKKKLAETYEGVEVDRIGKNYILSWQDRAKGIKKGTGQNLKEATYSFAVNNRLAPDHFLEVMKALEEGKDVSDQVLKSYYPDRETIETVRDRYSQKSRATKQIPNEKFPSFKYLQRYSLKDKEIKKGDLVIDGSASESNYSNQLVAGISRDGKRYRLRPRAGLTDEQRKVMAEKPDRYDQWVEKEWLYKPGAKSWLQEFDKELYKAATGLEKRSPGKVEVSIDYKADKTKTDPQLIPSKRKTNYSRRFSRIAKFTRSPKTNAKFGIIYALSI